MGYIGENIKFSFRDGFCEPLAETVVTSSDIADFGRALAGLFSRISLGCENEDSLHMLYAMSSGIAECGKDVFLCKNTDLPSFRHGLPITASECGVYFSGNLQKFSFFDENGFPLNDTQLENIMNAGSLPKAIKCGKITLFDSLKQIYINNITDSVNVNELPIKAGISCGSKIIRSLWLNFFTGEDDSLIFQISDDGQKVNAYSTELGFISHEKLVLAYALMNIKSGGILWLPNDFHYAAKDIRSESNIIVKEYNPQSSIPDEAILQRFMKDPLFMCVALAKERNILYKTLKNLPRFASAKREIVLNLCPQKTFAKTVYDPRGRVNITKSGKSRVTLIAQAYDSETAAELCSTWQEKLQKLSSCNNFFH